jgi:3-methyl-2-oxobutanoate hydroxymethyltransferase
MGHLGLTPQSVHQFGGFRAQATTVAAGRRLLEDAEMLQDAGCFSLVLESVPGRLAKVVSERLEIPTIGIGAGPGCDGQVLVTHDVLGLFDRFTPRFVEKYADLHKEMARALTSFKEDIERRSFPAPKHTVEMSDDEWERFEQSLGA